MQSYKMKAIVFPLYCLITFFQPAVNAAPELPEETGELMRITGQRMDGIRWDFFLFHSDYFSGDLFSEYGGTPIFGSDTGLGTEKQCKGNPIMVQSGNKMEFENDYIGNGEFPLNIKRTYNKNWYGNGLFGKKWISDFGRKLLFTSYNYDVESCNIFFPKGVTKPSYCSTPPFATKILAIKPDGKGIDFNYNYDTNEWRDGKAESVQKIEQDGDVWELTTESKFVERYNEQGQIIKRINPVGLYHLYTYSRGLLTKVSHSSGRELLFTYRYGQLVSIHSSNSQFDYTYNNDDYLASVIRAGTPNLRKDYYYEDSRYRGALTKIKVNNQDFAHFTYNDYSKGASTHHEGGVEKFTFEYGTNSTTVTNPLGHESTYQYKIVNGRKKLDKTDRASGTYCSAASSSVTYDTYGYIDRETDWKGYVTDFDYNAKGQLIKKTLGSGTSSATVINYLWLAGENKISEQSTADSKTTFDYASNGRLNFVEITNSSHYGNTNETRKTAFSYTSNSEGIVTQRIVDGPRTDVNDTVIYDFDSQGNLTTLTNALGQSTHYTLYDDAGNVGKITDPNGLQIDFTYDKASRVLTRSVLNSTSTQTTSYDYNGIGKIDKITFPNDSSQSFIYDPAHRLIQKLNGEGDIITYEYTDNSDISSTTISKETATTVYPCGNAPPTLMSTTPTLRRPTPKPPIDLCAPYTTTNETDYFSQNTEYDEMARVRKTLGNHNQQSVFGYDDNSNVSVIMDSKGALTLMSYNALNQLTQTVASDGGVSKYTYDEGGRVKSVIDARNLKTEYHYNGFGDLVELISPDTGTTIFSYNQSGQVTSKTLADGVQSTYIYDPAGRIISETNGGMTKTYVYDSGSYRKGRLYYVNDSSGQTRYYYDKLGNVTQKRSTIDTQVYNTYYQYNTMNQVTKVTYPSGHIINYTYNSKGQTDRVTYQSSGTASAEDIATNLQYKPFGPMKSLRHGNGAVRTIRYDSDYRPFSIYTSGILDLDYLFDTNNNITKITNNKVSANTQTYTYDTENRLSDVTSDSGNHTYSYDKVGNRKTHNSDNLVYAINSNRLTSFNSSSITLNANGQTTYKNGTTYNYNGENRLSSSVKNGMTTNYTYNALGQRVKKASTHYLYNEAGQLIAEHNTAGTVQKEYIYLHGQVVAVIKGGVRYYVHNDHLGRAERITNQSKSTVWRASNYAFDRAVNTNTIGDYNLGFPGQYFDKETGTYYNYFRNYDPSTGRYLQSDPIGLVSGVNTYIYVDANPINYVDRLGLSPCPASTAVCTVPTGIWGPLKDKVTDKAWDKISSSICDGAKNCTDIRKNIVKLLKGQPVLVAINAILAGPYEKCVMDGVAALCEKPKDPAQCKD